MGNGAKRLPAYFVSHGGGPWPYMKEETGGAFDRLEASLVAIREELGARPRAVLVVTGHWEETEFAVSSGERPGMLYDYSGFPEHTYRVKYAAPGDPALAARVRGLLEGAGLRSRLDAERGFDHGTFTPLVPMYPDADVPVVQLSIRRDYDPEAHLRAGRALAPLRSEGVLILGSGLSYHNLRRFGPAGAEPSRLFDRWLNETLAVASPEERTRRLLAWAEAPAARLAHPREDHLVPLFVALGAAEGEKSAVVYHEDDFMGSLAVSSFRFG